MHSSNPKSLVTVAMVTFNSEKYVAMAIESVLSSSYEHFELLISDDNSCDKTWEIIKSYTDPRIRAVRNEKNIGEYPNRNQCIERSSGKYLLFIDGDDMIYPHGLEFMVKMFERFPHCGMALMRWYKRNIFYPVTISPHQFYQGVYFNYGFNDIAFSNTLFNTQVLKAEKGLSVRYVSGDNYIRLVLGKKYDTLLISDGLTWWRETPNQASSKISASAKAFMESIDLELEMLKAHCPLTEMEINEAKQNIETKILRQLARVIILPRPADS